jgi:hypothetical protein
MVVSCYKLLCSMKYSRIACYGLYILSWFKDNPRRFRDWHLSVPSSHIWVLQSVPRGDMCPDLQRSTHYIAQYIGFICLQTGHAEILKLCIGSSELEGLREAYIQPFNIAGCRMKAGSRDQLPNSCTCGSGVHWTCVHNQLCICLSHLFSLF